MLTFLCLLLAIYILLFLTLPLIILFHELGHALAFLILTKPRSIDVFVGSYGDRSSKIKFKIGRLHFFIKVSFLLIVRSGLCKPDKRESNFIKMITIYLAGPVFSVAIACIFSIIVFNSDVHGAIKFYCFALIIFSVISLIQNLIPRTIKSLNVDTDGKGILVMLRMRKFYREYVSAINSMEEENYEDATAKFKILAAAFPKDASFLRTLVNLLVFQGRYNELEPYMLKLKKIDMFSANDYFNLGLANSLTERHESALENYRAGLKIDPDNLNGLNNLGYELALQEEYTESENILKRALEICHDFSHPYSNLGYIEISRGNLEYGRELIEKSIELDPNNPYAYEHLGIYYLKVFDDDKAQLQFDKALTINPHMKFTARRKSFENATKIAAG